MSKSSQPELLYLWTLNQNSWCRRYIRLTLYLAHSFMNSTLYLSKVTMTSPSHNPPVQMPVTLQVMSPSIALSAVEVTARWARSSHRMSAFAACLLERVDHDVVPTEFHESFQDQAVMLSCPSRRLTLGRARTRHVTDIFYIRVIMNRTWRVPSWAAIITLTSEFWLGGDNTVPFEHMSTRSTVLQWHRIQFQWH